MARFGTVHPPKGLFLETFLSNFVELRACEVRRIHLLRLAEKVQEQRSERGFGWYTEREKGPQYGSTTNSASGP
jgi:hypothetical protein